jgi:hypothetical protein
VTPTFKFFKTNPYIHIQPFSLLVQATRGGAYAILKVAKAVRCASERSSDVAATFPEAPKRAKFSPLFEK